MNEPEGGCHALKANVKAKRVVEGKQKECGVLETIGKFLSIDQYNTVGDVQLEHYGIKYMPFAYMCDTLSKYCPAAR